MKAKYETPNLIWVQIPSADVLTTSNPKNELEPDWNL